MPSKSQKKSASTTSKAAPAPAPVVAPVVVVAPPAPEPVPVPPSTDEPSSEVTFEDRFKSLTTILNTVVSTAKSALQEIVRLRKDVARLQRESNRRNRRRANKNNGDKPKREPSGFAKPTEISKALAKFLGEKEGILLARTEVTKKITAYIKAHDLQNPSNKREILPDAALKKLLALTDQSEALTFFNLQRYMKPHFLKAVVAALPTATPSA